MDLPFNQSKRVDGHNSVTSSKFHFMF